MSICWRRQPRNKGATFKAFLHSLSLAKPHSTKSSTPHWTSPAGAISQDVRRLHFIIANLMSLSKLSRANKSNHFRSDPVRVQSTVKQRQQTANYTPAKEKRYLCPPGLNSRAYADCRSQKFCCGRPQRSLLGLYRPQSAMSCSTLRERAA